MNKLLKANTIRTSRQVLAAFTVLVLPLTGHAKQCDGEGQLRYLGASAGGGRSVWLSTTSTGAYRLDAAQGNQTVDVWSKGRQGLHLSLSPVVSNGNGGTHKLYSSNDNCLLDTQNQKNGFVFPPSIIPPGVTRPPANRPLIPLTPTLPGVVTPPIGTLPSTPLTPTVPGVVVPPIATLPTTPLTPTVPGAVVPPIATLPTTPLTPTVPGAVTPPIGTLPEVPPFGGGKTEGENNGGKSAALLVSLPPCRRGNPEDTGNVEQSLDCYQAVQQSQSLELPLTPGRELVVQSEWNVWMNGSGARLKDQRDGMDTHGNSGAVSIGLDRVVSNDLVVGLQLSLVHADSNSFGGDLHTTSNGYSVGPYVSYSISPNWFIYGALGLGRESVDTRILSFNGTSDANLYSLNMQAEGQYAVGSAFARPKVQLSHTHTSGDTYQLRGSILNTPVKIDMKNQSNEYGVLQASLEINQTFDVGNRSLVMPYIEAGFHYEYAGPQSGKHLTSNLTYADTSLWGGMLRAGVRSLFDKSTMASLELSNQSLGVKNLSIWGLQVFVSHAF